MCAPLIKHINIMLPVYALVLLFWLFLFWLWLIVRNQERICMSTKYFPLFVLEFIPVPISLSVIWYQSKWDATT